MVICLEALVKDKEILTNYYQNIDEADPMKSHFKKLSQLSVCVSQDHSAILF